MHSAVQGMLRGLALPVAMCSGHAAQARPLAAPSPRLHFGPQGSEASRDIVMPDYTFWGHEYQYLQVVAGKGGRALHGCCDLDGVEGSRRHYLPAALDCHQHFPFHSASSPCPPPQDPWGHPAHGWAGQAAILSRKYENVSLADRVPQAMWRGRIKDKRYPQRDALRWGGGGQTLAGFGGWRGGRQVVLPTKITCVQLRHLLPLPCHPRTSPQAQVCGVRQGL